MGPLNWLNPSAGDVPLPSDPREVDAALRASQLSWRRCPYYAWRYGDRGRAFSNSDSAWLVTLTTSTQAQVTEQVLWLAGLLSNRGAPRWLLEMHLDVLYRKLVGLVPEKAAHYEKLLKAAKELQRSRTKRISEGDFDALSSAFANSLGCESNRLVVQVGGLIVAAVADEKAGVKYAVPRLEAWLTDPARFDEIGDMHATLLRRHRTWLEQMRQLHRRWAKAVLEAIGMARHI
jgi:hypothetical protein